MNVMDEFPEYNQETAGPSNNQHRKMNPVQSILLSSAVAASATLGTGFKPQAVNAQAQPTYENKSTESNRYYGDFERETDQVDLVIERAFDEYLLSLPEEKRASHEQYWQNSYNLIRTIYNDIYTDKSIEEFESIPLTKLISFMVHDRKKVEDDQGGMKQKARPIAYAGPARTKFRLLSVGLGSEALGYNFTPEEWEVINTALNTTEDGDSFFGNLSSNYYTPVFGDKTFLFFDPTVLNPENLTRAEAYNVKVLTKINGLTSDHVTRWEIAGKKTPFNAAKFRPKLRFSKNAMVFAD